MKTKDFLHTTPSNCNHHVIHIHMYQENITENILVHAKHTSTLSDIHTHTPKQQILNMTHKDTRILTQPYKIQLLTQIYDGTEVGFEAEAQIGTP